jgi:hypothetical protein
LSKDVAKALVDARGPYILASLFFAIGLLVALALGLMYFVLGRSLIRRGEDQ